MRRLAENDLAAWADRPDRMPLIVRGARQVGKTYLVETFGRQRFESVLTVNLEQKDDLHTLTASVGSRHGTRTLTYTLVSLPLYLASELDRLLREHLSQA